jgi:hypothetical protein
MKTVWAVIVSFDELSDMSATPICASGRSGNLSRLQDERQSLMRGNILLRMVQLPYLLAPAQAIFYEQMQFRDAIDEPGDTTVR